MVKIKLRLKTKLLKYSAFNLLKLISASSIDHRSSILQAVTTKFGSTTTDELKSHGCWASKLDTDNNAWNGGTLKVDSVDEYFSKWFSACKCLELDNAECSTGLDTGCQSKLDEIEVYYLDLIETEMSSFVLDASQTCVHSDTTASNGGNNVDNRGNHCQNVVPNYVSPLADPHAPQSVRSGCSFSARGIERVNRGYEIVDCSDCAATSEPVYGNLFYTMDSDICQAALFEGLITVDGFNNYQGSVTVYAQSGQSSYSSSSNNGVTTESHGEFTAGSFCFSANCLPVQVGGSCDSSTTCENSGMCAEENNICCKAGVENCGACSADGECEKCSAGYDFNRFTDQCETFGASPGGVCSGSETCQTEDGTLTSCVGGVCCKAGVPADCDMCVEEGFPASCNSYYVGSCAVCSPGKKVDWDGMSCLDDIVEDGEVGESDESGARLYYVGIELTPGNGQAHYGDATQSEYYSNTLNKTSLWKLTARDGTTCTIPYWHVIIDYSNPQYGLNLDDSLSSHGFCKMTMSQVEAGLEVEGWMPSETDYEAGNVWNEEYPDDSFVNYRMQELESIKIVTRTDIPLTAVGSHAAYTISCNNPNEMWFLDSGADAGAQSRQDTIARCQMGEFSSCTGEVTKFKCGALGVCETPYLSAYLISWREQADTTYHLYGYPSSNSPLKEIQDNKNSFQEYDRSYTTLQLKTAAGTKCNLLYEHTEWELFKRCWFPVVEMVNKTFTVTGQAVEQEGDVLYDDMSWLNNAHIAIGNNHKIYETYYAETHGEHRGMDCPYCLPNSIVCATTHFANILWDNSVSEKNYQFPHKTSAMRGCVGDSCEGGAFSFKCNHQNPYDRTNVFVKFDFKNYEPWTGPYTREGESGTYARGNSKIHVRVTSAAGTECYLENWRYFLDVNSDWSAGYCYFPVEEVKAGGMTVEYWQEGDYWQDVETNFHEKAAERGFNASNANMEDHIERVYLYYNDNTPDEIQYNQNYAGNGPFEMECDHPDKVWFIDGDDTSSGSGECARGCCKGLNGPRCKHTCSHGISMTSWVEPGENCSESSCSGMGCRNGVCCDASVPESCASCGGDGLCDDA